MIEGSQRQAGPHATGQQRVPNQGGQLLTLDEVAARLRRTPAQVRWMRHTGAGPRSAKIAGRVMFREHDVEAWIDAQFEAEHPDRTAV